MILDSGLCTIYRKRNVAGAGEKPRFADEAYWQSWFGYLSYETEPSRPTDKREEVHTMARIRILQNKTINNHDRVELQMADGEMIVYEAGRAYHGRDDESGELITDLNLEVYKP